MYRVMEVGMWEAPLGHSSLQEGSSGSVKTWPDKKQGDAEAIVYDELVSDLSKGWVKAKGALHPPEHEGAPLWANCANNTVSTGWACKQVSLGSICVVFSTPFGTFIPLTPQDNRLCGLLTGSG